MPSFRDGSDVNEKRVAGFNLNLGAESNLTTNTWENPGGLPEVLTCNGREKWSSKRQFMMWRKGRRRRNADFLYQREK